MRVLVDVTFEVEAGSEDAAERIVQDLVDNAPTPSSVRSSQVFEPYQLSEVSA